MRRRPLVKKRLSQRRGFKKTRNLFIGAGSIFAIILACGIFYTWHYGNDSKVVIAPEPVAVSTGSIVKRSSNPNARVGASVQMLTSPVQPGSEASINVKTNSEALCKIEVTYDNVLSKNPALKPQRADIYGIVSWSWTVESSAPAGKWPVKVTCANQKYSGMVIGDLEVVR